MLVLVCAIREVVLASESVEDGGDADGGNARLAEEVSKGLGWTLLLSLQACTAIKHAKRVRTETETRADVGPKGSPSSRRQRQWSVNDNR